MSVQALYAAVTAVQRVLLVAFSSQVAGALGAGSVRLTSPKGSVQTMSSCDCAGVASGMGKALRVRAAHLGPPGTGTARR